MSDLNVATIQSDLKISLSKFMKIRKIVQNKTEEVGLGKKLLKTNQMKKEFYRLVEQDKLKMQKYIKCIDIK